MIEEILTSIKNIDGYLTIIIYTLAIIIYSLFIWKFYRFLARRDLLKINLQQYNKTSHQGRKKFFSALLYILEYIIILPIIVSLWFGVLTALLIILSESESVSYIVLISASIVASVRIISYFSEDLSKDIAKIFPFTLLAVFIINPSFISSQSLISRIEDFSSLIGPISSYLLFAIALEIIMRLLYFFSYQVWQNKEEIEKEEEN